MRYPVAALILVLLVGGLASASQIPPMAPGFGLGVSLPLFTSPTIQTAITFIDLYAETPLTEDMATRLDLAFYLSSTLLRIDLTSTRGELLLFLNRGPARFYVGGGLGTFPYENFSLTAETDPGFLLELNEVVGFRVLTQLFSIFAELKYAQMPQPVALCDLDGDGDCDGTGVISNLQLTIGALINFGAPICWCCPCPEEEESSS
jgi:hypothetical protein